MKNVMFACVFLLALAGTTNAFNPGRAEGPLGWHYGENILWVRASGQNEVMFGVSVGVPGAERVIILSGTTDGIKAMQAVLLTAYLFGKPVNFHVSLAVYGTPYSYKIDELIF